MSEQWIYMMKALTDVWTGDLNGKQSRLVTTGLLGSIRWWFEVVVRGLGGSACDPTRHDCCDRRHCVACELFGCTGWARKFRFDVLDADGSVQCDQITAGSSFQLSFTPLRPIREEERALLALTLRLIADYGAMGGKTVLKPSSEPKRADEEHHRDYGIVRLVDSPPIGMGRAHLSSFVGRGLRTCGGTWASIKTMWCVRGRYLARENTTESSFNKVLGRNESKECRDCGAVHDPPEKCGKTKSHPRRQSELLGTDKNGFSRWLAGGRGESKKIFSFKHPSRTFGFVRSGDEFESILRRLKTAWMAYGFTDKEFVRGGAILDAILGPPEASS